MLSTDEIFDESCFPAVGKLRNRILDGFFWQGGVSGVCQSTVSGDKVQSHAMQQRTVSPEHVQRLLPAAGDPHSNFAVVMPLARTPLV